MINWDSVSSFIQTFPRDSRMFLAKKLKHSMHRKQERLKSYRQSRARLYAKIKSHTYELNIKYSFALSCLVFLFIGAPMGAIIRKGGFGYPILVSVAFFVVFILATILCKKLMESNTLTAFWAAWVPLLTLVPIGAYLTYKAMVNSRFEWVALVLRFFSRSKS